LEFLVARGAEWKEGSNRLRRSASLRREEIVRNEPVLPPPSPCSLGRERFSKPYASRGRARALALVGVADLLNRFAAREEATLTRGFRSSGKLFSRVRATAEPSRGKFMK
jgi:hypothetical protein